VRSKLRFELTIILKGCQIIIHLVKRYCLPLFIFLGIFVPALAQDKEPAVFPLQIDWLASRYAPANLTMRRGMSLATDNFVNLNRNILKVKFPGMKTIRQADKSGGNLLISSELNGAPVLDPIGIAVNRYFDLRRRLDWRSKFVEITLAKPTETTGGGSDKLELIGADIAGQHVALRVSGNVNINGRLQSQNSSQVSSTYSTGTSTSFIVDQKQQLNIEGKIGDRISILVDQDSERDFDFENNLKIIYTGKEDDIVQKVEAGNISLSLPGTQYVTFSGTNNGLYGFKSLMQFGGVDVTAIASVEKGKKEKLSIDGGAQTSKISIKDYDYRKNTYFYLDSLFRENMYSSYQKNHQFVQDSRGSVEDLKVYKSQTIETAGCIRGTAYVDPRDTSKYSEYKAIRLFKLLELNKDYVADESMGYLRMTTQLQDGEVLAVAYRIIDLSGNTVSGEEYGDYARTDTASGTNYVLKLIKPETLLPSHPCWDLEFKNIYYLGTTGIEKDGFSLDILYTQGGSKVDYDAATGKNFLQLFGLDLVDDNGSANPNGVIDADNAYILNLTTGELWFPFLRPFQYDSSDIEGKRNPNLSRTYNCSAMYDSNRTDYSDINNDSKFEIAVSYENRSSILSLGAMVIENSETVSLNSVPLTRNVDYTIDYFTGTLTLLNPDATNPDANLEVKYEKNQFFQLDKKTILGARAQYDFGENSFIGGTALYYSQSVTDEKVEVGYEPYRNFVWDLNGKYSTKLDFLTRAINWLPLISTNTESALDFEGEIAQVIPTVNTLSNEETGDQNGVGFIDDFESSERVTAPPIMRRYWNQSSVPIGKTLDERGNTIWYNPYGSVATTSIWPDKEVSTTAQNTTTEVLVLRVDPAWSVAVVDGVASNEAAWGGITYSFPQSYYDQSNSKYVDIWIKGTSGTVHVDLGSISEDQNDNNLLDTEDKPESGLSTGNGLLDEDKEDTGIDGVWDEAETIETLKYGTLAYGDIRLKEYNRDPYDPHSDNWKYSESSRDYSKVNGTENNLDDASNGRYPDTEDLDNDYALDVTNDYYTVSFDLADENCPYIAGATAISGKPTGWKLYRLPLSVFSNSTTGTDVSWENIKACRLWYDGLSHRDSLYIAQIELVGNEWEELGVAANDTATFVEKEATFTMSVINTEDNPDIYDAPQGVMGEYDQVTQTRAKEQSLVLILPEDGDGLYPGEICASKKVLTEEASYITYKEMKMFVKGYELKADGYEFSENEETPIQLFVRFGKIYDDPTTTNYYEYRQPVYPGWDSQNEMKLDLDFLTTLKLYNTAAQYVGDGEFSIDTNAAGVVIRHYKELNADGQYTGKELMIYGNPSLASIKRIDVGLRNRDNNLNCANAFKTGTIKGQVWLDELRLSEVRSDKGMAYRVRGSLKMADLANFDVTITHKDADFHTVEQRSSLETDNLKTTETISATGRFSLDKLTPASWGLTIPVTGSYTRTTGTRKYVYGSDILMEDNPADSLLDISRSYGVNTSFKKRSSDFWLSKYTIDQIQMSLNAAWSEGSTVTTRESKSESYKGNISYQFPFPKEKYLQPLKWIAKVPVLGDKLSETRLYYLPNNLSVSADAGKGTSYSIPRIGTTITSSNNFDLNRNLAFGYKMFDNLSVNYTLNLDNNLIELWQRQWEALQTLNPGKLENYRESYTASFTPKIFKWFSPSFNYTSNFNWSDPLAQNTDYVDAVSNQRRISTTFSLDPATIFSSFFKSTTPEPAKPSSAPSGEGRGRPSRNTNNQAPGQEQVTNPGQPPESGTAPARNRSKPKSFPDEKQPVNDSQPTPNLLKEPTGVKKSSEWAKTVAKYLKKIQTINVSFSTNNSINNRYIMGMPDIRYRLGLTQDPGLPLDTTSMIAKNLKSTAQSLDGSIRSGLSLFSNVNIPLTYSQTMSISQSQSTISRTLTRDYLPMGSKGKDGFPFPGWSLTWGQLEKYSLFSKIFKKLSLDHGFSGKETIISQNGKEMSSSYKLYFQPLVGLSMQFANDISASARVTGGQTINNTSSGTGGTTKIDDAAVSATVNWQKKGGFSIPLPLLKNKRFENSLTVSANFDYSTSQTRIKNDTSKKYTVSSKSNNWKTTPKVNYTFSKKVTGGLFFEYGESYNKNTGRRINRNYGFDVNIAIRG